MSEVKNDPSHVRAVRIEMEVPIQAPRERLWKALVDETGAWWLEAFFATPAPRQLRIEPWPGGRMLEEGADGAGLLWYTVIELRPGAAITLAGHIAPPWGGPASDILRLVLEDAAGSGSVLKVTDCLYGVVSPGTEANIDKGWHELFEQGLRRHLEDGGNDPGR